MLEGLTEIFTLITGASSAVQRGGMQCELLLLHSSSTRTTSCAVARDARPK